MKTIKPRKIALAGTVVAAVAPVSYTQLDVYKRQLQITDSDTFAILRLALL